MSFTSLFYFPLLGATALVFRFLPKRIRIMALLVLSWWIYFLYGWLHVALLICMTICSYVAGRILASWQSQITRKGTALFCVAGMVLFLFYVKKNGIAIGNKMVIPVGISFYIFQALSYLIDIYHGGRAERSFTKYALYLGFFPQVVAGPIEQADHLIPQFDTAEATGEDVSEGITYLLSGCVRKFVIADYMALIADRVYGSVYSQSGMSLLLATVAFAFQIYGDFSGYTHIAIGSARLFGIRLTENFDRPYLAAGCRDFWKRWHITLTQWFAKYLYLPLGGNQKKYRNILIVFLVSGLWHGTDLTFVCWGAYFGIWRIAEDMLVKKGIIGRTDGNEQQISLWMKRGLTFSAVCLSWVFFRSRNMAEAGEVFRRIFGLVRGTEAGIGLEECMGIGIRAGLLAGLPMILRPQEDGRKCYYRNAGLVFLIIISMLWNFKSGGDSSFIYFQF